MKLQKSPKSPKQLPPLLPRAPRGSTVASGDVVRLRALRDASMVRIAARSEGWSIDRCGGAEKGRFHWVTKEPRTLRMGGIATI